MKVFISQPMRGKSSEEILNERNKAIELLNKEFDNVEVIDSYKDFAIKPLPLGMGIQGEGF